MSIQEGERGKEHLRKKRRETDLKESQEEAEGEIEHTEMKKLFLFHTFKHATCWRLRRRPKGRK